MLAQPPLPLPDRWTLGDLERMRLVLRGASVIDWRKLHFHTREEVDRYLRLCLFEPDDPFDRAQLQRILDEAVDYLRTTFRYSVAEEVAQPAQVQDLFVLASGVGERGRALPAHHPARRQLHGAAPARRFSGAGRRRQREDPSQPDHQAA